MAGYIKNYIVRNLESDAQWSYNKCPGLDTRKFLVKYVVVLKSNTVIRIAY